MKALATLLLAAWWTGIALAELPAAQNLNRTIPEAKARYGLDNVKVVMPGVLYRGGGTGPRTPLPPSALRALCKDGFAVAVYVYSKAWQGGDKVVECGEHRLVYISEPWDHPDKHLEILKKLHRIIQDGRGAMYVHCWYGVHASGYVAATALMQFCGLSSTQAVAYWNDNVPRVIQYPKVQEMIRSFRPYPELQITTAQQARVCPDGL